jgi:hypothetical protein
MQTTPNTANPARAFKKGLSELRVKDVKEARARLTRILEITTNASFNNYASGRVKTLDVEKAKQIEAVFAYYGVKEPWGL